MVYCFKIDKQKFAYDTSSGAVLPVTSLESKMIQAIVPPLSPACPSSLRYELAKYDSTDVEETYDRIYALSCEGILFASMESDQIHLRIGGPYGIADADHITREIAKQLNGKQPYFLIAECLPDEKIDEIKALF